MAAWVLTPDYVFEESIKHNVLVTSSESNVEQRRIKSQNPRYTFRLSFINRSQTDYETAKAFVKARKGSYESFDFTHPTDGLTYPVRFVDNTFKSDMIKYRLYNFEFSVISTGVAS